MLEGCDRRVAKECIYCMRGISLNKEADELQLHSHGLVVPRIVQIVVHAATTIIARLTALETL